jgi:hypothetical protein
MTSRRLAFVVAAAAFSAACAPEDKICRSMSDLCGTAAAECRASVADLRSSGGDEAVKELEQCYANADTCAKARGCEAALAAKSALSGVTDFLESFSEGIGSDEKER